MLLFYCLSLSLDNKRCNLDNLILTNLISVFAFAYFFVNLEYVSSPFLSNVTVVPDRLSAALVHGKLAPVSQSNLKN